MVETPRATTCCTSQIIFGIASGPGAFYFYFNGLKCHVRFPRNLVHRDAVDIMWRKMGKWGCKTNKELIEVSHAEVPSIT